MKILIVRHGEPDYEKDTLTEKGMQEAELLVRKLNAEGVSEIYSSPMGRAKATAAPFARESGLKIHVKDWLHEFKHRMPSGECSWSMSPANWIPDGYESDWREREPWKSSEIPEYYDYVSKELDQFMAEQGYDHKGFLFDCTGKMPNNKTIAFFCHLGLGTMLLSYFLNMPLPQAWHHFFMATSSVTTIYMESRDNKKALARAAAVGDTGHLLTGGLVPSNWGLWE